MKGKKIVIIGAGPGGLATAEEAARLGQDVLVLEKNKEYKRKVCAEAVTGKIMEKFPYVYHSVERGFLTAKVFSYHRTCYFRRRTPFILTMNRKVLSDIQEQRAKTAGAKIQRGVAVSEITDDYVLTTSGDKIKYDILIGADGNKSIVRKSLNIPTVFYGVGIQYRIPKESDTLIIHLDPRLWGHTYAWVFPHKDYTSIGTGYSRVQSGKVFARNLRFIGKQFGFDTTNLKLEADIINADFRGYQFGNKYLVGEASGLISGLTGEGIYNAMVMGQEVARQIISGRKTSPVLQGRMRKKHLHEMLIRSYYTWPEFVAMFYRFAPELKIFKQ